MAYDKGQIVSGTINKISSNGVYIEFDNNDGYGFLPTYFMSDISEKGEILLKKYQRLTFAIEKLKDEGRNFYIVSQTKYNKLIKKLEIEKQKEEQLRLFDSIVSAIHPGDVFECRIVKATSNRIQLEFDGFTNAFVEKDEIAWGNQDARNQSFCDGQIVDAAFLYGDSKDGTLFFSLKRLRKNPYDEDVYSFDTDKLLDFLGVKKNLFVGKCVRVNEHLYFLVDIISYNNQIDEDLEGELLVNPYTGANLQALFKTADTSTLIDGNYYQVELIAAPSDYRKIKNEPFIFGVASFSNFEGNPYKFIVDDVFKKSDNPHSNTTIARLLEEVGKQMYSSKDRTFFELLQNADDAAAPKSENSVEIVVQAKDDYLLFCHNGCAFNRSDFISISSAANSTKRKQGNKTGYKGIGFKSVFSDADSVHLLSRGFNVKFEKDSPVFKDFHGFYYKARNCRSEEEYKRLMAPFRDDEKNFRGVSDMPWQILPLWEDNEDVFSSVKGDYNVYIGIKTRVVKLYERSIKELDNQPEFLLFLRNTKRLNMFGKVLEKSMTLGKIVLRSDSQTKRYIKRDFSDIPVTNEEFSKFPNINLQIQEVHNPTTGEIELHFFENGQDKSSTIPNKLAESGMTTISFVSNVEGELIIPKELQSVSAPLFAYLPTSDKRFPFPFFVNADFVLSSNRESIQGDNPWNIYIFAKIAHCLVLWVSEISSVYQPNYLKLLVSEYLNEEGSDTKMLAASFNQAYKEALAREEFILNDYGEKASCDQILIDKSQISTFLDGDAFYSLVGVSKHLPNAALDFSILEKDIFGIEKLTRNNIYDYFLNDIEHLRTWISSSTEEQRNNFFAWLAQDKNDKEIINHIPLIQFSNNWYSPSELASKTNYIITSSNINDIVNILTKLGFICSNTIVDNHPLASRIETLEEQDLFILIKEKDISSLSLFERLSLMKCVAGFKGVGDAAISKWPLFKNKNNSFCKLSNMYASKGHVESYMYNFVINDDDYCEDLDKYLVPKDDSFANIIWPNRANIVEKIGIENLYHDYTWTDEKYTIELITECKSNEHLEKILSIVESSSNRVKSSFLEKIKELSISKGVRYLYNTFENRVLRLVLSVLEKPSNFSSKIIFDEVRLSSFSFKDDVTCEYVEAGTNKSRSVKFSLEKLLPSSSENTSLISIFKSSFEGISQKELDKLFDIKEKSPSSIEKEIRSVLDIPYGYTDYWPTGRGCAQQYLFYVYYYRNIKGWTSNYVLRIKLEDESFDFIKELFDFLFSNKIDIETSPFTYRINIKGKYFTNNYILSEEKLLPTIEKWADTTDKVQFLTQNGVKNVKSNSIELRKAIVENQDFEHFDKISEKEIKASLSYIVKERACLLPFTGKNQRTILLKIRNEYPSLFVSYIDEDTIEKNSRELDTLDYLEWVKGSTIKIFAYNGLMPCLLDFNNIDLLNIVEDDEYYYSESENKLYINNLSEISDVLFEVAKTGKTKFRLEDYRNLFVDGKISVSKELIEEKDKKISKLQAEKENIESILMKYKQRYGDIDSLESTISISDANNTASLRKADANALSKQQKMEAQLEAQKYLRSVKPMWTFPDNYAEVDEDGKPYCFSTFYINDEMGDRRAILLKSYKYDKAPFSINPEEWDYIIKKEARLLIYKGNDIVEIHKDDLVRNQNSINLRFSTENLDIEDKITQFSDALHYFNQINFDFESFNVSKRAKSILGITNKNEGTQTGGSDEDI